MALSHAERQRITLHEATEIIRMFGEWIQPGDNMPSYRTILIFFSHEPWASKLEKR